MAGVFPGISQSFTISGRVMNDAMPLAGATVEIKKLKKIAVSDTAGYFSTGYLFSTYFGDWI